MLARLILFLFCCWSLPVLSNSDMSALSAGHWRLPLQVSVLEDAAGTLSVQDLSTRQEGFRPVALPDELNLGYSRSIWWARVTVAVPPEAPAVWRLQVAYPSLDKLDVWVPQGDGWRTYEVGDHRLFSQRPVPHRNFVFPAELRPGKTATFYLRMRSEGTVTAPISLQSVPEFIEDTERGYLWQALYFGMLFALGGYNLLLYWSLRDRIYLRYVAFVAGLAIGQVGQSGLGAQYLWQQWPLVANLAYPIGFGVAGVFGAMFTRDFLNTDQQLPRFHQALTWLARAFVLATLIVLVDYRSGAQALSVVGVTAAVLAIATGLSSWRQGNPSARIFLLAWVFLLLGAALMGLRTMGVLPTNPLTLHGLQVGSGLEMLLLSFALADRFSHLRQEKLAAQAEALVFERQLRAALEINERELEERVAERTSALERANQQLRDNEERFRYMAQHDPLTGLANRVLLYDRLEHLLRRSQRNEARFAILMLDLDGFKQVNDTHGHAAGDFLLTVIAGRLLTRMRASDTVARIGGDEFAVLMEPSAGYEESLQVGDKLLTALCEPVRLENGVEVQVGGSIGIALWPKDGSNAEELLRAADQHMYRAKENGNSIYSEETPFTPV